MRYTIKKKNFYKLREITCIPITPHRVRKQEDISRDNAKENSLRINHDYQTGDKVLITNNDIDKKIKWSH